MRKTADYMKNVLRELRLLPSETEWVEFKHNSIAPEEVGKYISALSNSAAISGRNIAYIVWGIDDKSHEILGSNFHYRDAKKGNEELEAWLTRLIEPRINIEFYELEEENKHVVMLSIQKANVQPTKFSGEAYIRIGSTTKKLKEHLEKERALWKSFDSTPEELKISYHNAKTEQVLNFLNYEEYYKRLDLSIPNNKKKIIGDFINEKFIQKNDAGSYDITNIGALLFAKDVTKFDNISHKYIRVIRYKDKNKLETIREEIYLTGYVNSYEKIIEYIMAVIPQREEIENGIRRSIFDYPEIAIRELVANSMIHQDLSSRGTSPMIEIYSNRIEFTNAGSPLVSVERIVDAAPVSRNEKLARFMHKCGICEERGSGYDKVVYSLSQNSMISPKVENQSDKFTKVTLYTKVPFDTIKKEDRLRTCYMYACILYLQDEAIDNATIRNLFDIPEKQKYKASRILKDSLENGDLILVDEEVGHKARKYIPFWG